MTIKSAVFIKSVVDDRGLPNDRYPQVALLGRSNVGKSSLINSLTEKSKLARSSSRPGHTKEINFYLINNNFYLVDLPGYGYAEGSKNEKQLLKDRIWWYLNKTILNQKIVLIVDVKVGLTKDDQEILEYLIAEKKDFLVVANKIDKLKQGELKKSLDKIKSLVGKNLLIPFSAKAQQGAKLLLDQISFS